MNPNTNNAIPLNTGSPQDRAIIREEMPLDADIESIEWSCAHTARAIRYILNEIKRIDRALNVGEEDSGHNFVEINKLRDEIQKLKNQMNQQTPDNEVALPTYEHIKRSL